jgi:hypothetical protein
VSAWSTYEYKDSNLSVGVVSLSSRSKARPSPLSSSTVLSLWSRGVTDLLRLGSEDASSCAVVNDSALDEGYVGICGRSGAASDVLVRGGLGSGVSGLRPLTGVLNDDCFETSESVTLSA